MVQLRRKILEAEIQQRRFVEVVAPDSNASVRVLRYGVIWLKPSLGTVIVAGERFVERLLSVLVSGESDPGEEARAGDQGKADVLNTA